MKRFFLAALMTFSMNAMADSRMEIPEGSTAISAIGGQVIDVQPLCPEDVVCFTNGTVVTVEITYGCMNTLGPVNAVAVESGENLEVVISATEIHHKDEMIVLCFAPNKEVRTFSFVNQYGDVRATFLGSNN